MDQILIGYDLPSEIATAKTILYKNTKAMFHSLDGDIDFYNIVPGIL